MGGAEVVFELNELIDHPGWKKAWLQYCRLTSAPKQVVAADMTNGTEGSDASHSTPGRLAGYAYLQMKNPAFAQRAWSQILNPRAPRYVTKNMRGPELLNPIDEVTGLSTNSVAQGCLQAIEVLAISCLDSFAGAKVLSRNVSPQ